MGVAQGSSCGSSNIGALYLDGGRGRRDRGSISDSPRTRGNKRGVGKLLILIPLPGQGGAKGGKRDPRPFPLEKEAGWGLSHM